MREDPGLKDGRCIKCGVGSGDSWSQCRGVCPVTFSPHFRPDAAERMAKVAAKRRELETLEAEIEALEKS